MEHPSRRVFEHQYTFRRFSTLDHDSHFATENSAINRIAELHGLAPGGLIRRNRASSRELSASYRLRAENAPCVPIRSTVAPTASLPLLGRVFAPVGNPAFEPLTPTRAAVDVELETNGRPCRPKQVCSCAEGCVSADGSIAPHSPVMGETAVHARTAQISRATNFAFGR